MTSLKVDVITFTYNAVDVDLTLSGSLATSGQYAAITGLIDNTTQNISTTGTISGGIFKASGNVTVITNAGAIYPYGLYSLASGTGTNGQALTVTTGNTTEWKTLPVIRTTAFVIGLNKC